MKAPEVSRDGTRAHASAVRRRDAARSEQLRRSEVRARAHGIRDERSATSDLAAANQELAAREAWVRWVERGY